MSNQLQPLLASSLSISYVMVERIRETSALVTELAGVVVGVLTVAWWVRLWWREMKKGADKMPPFRLPNGEDDER